MSPPRVDYDAIATTYNQRFSGEQRSDTRATLLALVRRTHSQDILEVGCGTAHWLAEVHAECSQETRLYGLDPSPGMLAQARHHNAPIRLVRGQAERLPFCERTFDLIYCVNALHHFDQPRLFVSEAYRLLRPGGALAVINMDPRSHRDRWYIYDYFAGTFETDVERFPSWGTVLDWLAETGFEQATWELAEHIHKPKFGAAVLEDPYLCKQSSSQLALLSDEAYERGLQRIRKALATAESVGETLIFQSEIYIC